MELVVFPRSRQNKVTMGFCVAPSAETLPERGRLCWSYLLLLSVVQKTGLLEGRRGQIEARGCQKWFLK